MITCDQCPDSACCRDVTVEIEEPETLEDWDEIRWMVAHKNVAVYVDNDDDWVVEFKTPCKKLDDKGKCTIYHERPQMCKEHELESCVYNGEGTVEKMRFDTMAQVEEHIKSKVKTKMIEELQEEMDKIKEWKFSVDQPRDSL